MARSNRVPPPSCSVGPSTVTQLIQSTEVATMSPSSSARARPVWVPGDDGKYNRPITARGTASRKNASASEGNGVISPRMVSNHVQISWPTAHDAHDAPTSSQPVRQARPCETREARRHDQVATSGATAWVMLPRLRATSGPPIPNPRASASSTTTAAAPAAAASKPLSRSIVVPREP